MPQQYGPPLPSLADAGQAIGPFDALRMLVLSGALAPIQNQMDELTGGAQQQADAAAARAAAAQQAFMQAQQAPIPQTPIADFAQRLGGNISQAIAPQMSGLAQAEGGIAQRRQELLAKRQEHLGVLETNYRQAAARAEALGDWATKLKFDDKIASLHKQQDMLINATAEQGAQNQKFKEQKTLQAADNAAALARTRIEDASRRYVADKGIEEAKIRSAPDPIAYFKAVMEPYDRQVQDAYKALNDISTNSNLKDGERTKRSKEVTNRLVLLLGQQDELRNSFDPVSGRFGGSKPPTPAPAPAPGTPASKAATVVRNIGDFTSMDEFNKMLETDREAVLKSGISPGELRNAARSVLNERKQKLDDARRAETQAQRKVTAGARNQRDIIGKTLKTSLLEMRKLVPTLTTGYDQVATPEAMLHLDPSLANNLDFQYWKQRWDMSMAVAHTLGYRVTQAELVAGFPSFTLSKE